MKRLITGWLLVSLAGCASRGAAPETMRERLVDQAGEYVRAMVEDDYARLARMTHHHVVEGLGGKGRFIERLEDATAERRRQGARWTNVLVGEPSELIHAGREVYAAIPIDIRLTRRDGVRGHKPSFLIAISRDRGATWVFVDGDSVGNDRNKMRLMLPNAPDALPLKGIVGPVWEEE